MFSNANGKFIDKGNLGIALTPVSFLETPVLLTPASNKEVMISNLIRL